MSEVKIGREGRVGRLTLDRPKALHALTRDMCAAMTDALLAWEADPDVDLVIIDHSGERGFCAGGDIRTLAESGGSDGAAARDFFFTEYRLNHLLFTYGKPVVAFMDGITMGGGVGISQPARYRVATERTTFAMPESGIGLFPDVGGGWYLPRLPGRTGWWLAVTGARIKSADCLALGLATHFVESTKLDTLKEAIAADPAAVERLLAGVSSDPGLAPVNAVRADLDRLFAGDSVEAIVAALEADGSEWAKAQLEALRTKSPQTLKIVMRQFAKGAAMSSFADNMALEYRIASHVVQMPDFLEGVRAVIVDKDNAPRWSPPRIEDVTEATLDAIFAPPPDGREWTPIEERRGAR